MISDKNIKEFISNCTIILTTGGEGSRMRAAGDENSRHKNVLPLPNGDTMIDRTIEMYKYAGFNKFVLLVYHNAVSVIESIGNGNEHGVDISYCIDPSSNAGKGGAIMNAILKGYVSKNEGIIIHNPDDQILNSERDFALNIVKSHLKGVKKGAKATVVLVNGTRYPYTEFKLKEDFVIETETYPLINMPTHIGVSMFSPSFFETVESVGKTHMKGAFETELFPELVERKMLHSTKIPHENWVAVNDEKSWNKFINYINTTS